MIPALAHPAIRHPGEQFQQVTAHIRYRGRHDRVCRRGHGSTNDRLTHGEAPVAGICERTPVPTGASSPSLTRHAAHDQIATRRHESRLNPSKRSWNGRGSQSAADATLPTITGLDPPQGPVGTLVAISGDNLRSVTGVA